MPKQKRKQDWELALDQMAAIQPDEPDKKPIPQARVAMVGPMVGASAGW